MKRGVAPLAGVAFLGLMLAGQTVIQDEQVIKKVPTTHKVAALTIDDGPHNKTTPQILAMLKEKQVKATFFVLGEHAQAYPDLILQEKAEGHEVGIHAYSHRLLTKLSRQEVGEELEKSAQALKNTGGEVWIFRPPGGAYNDMVLDEAHKRGYSVVLWSVDPGDWRRPTVDQVVGNVVDQVKPGGIILLHDGQFPLPTPQAIGRIVDTLRQQGYTFVTVSELLQYDEEPK